MKRIFSVLFILIVFWFPLDASLFSKKTTPDITYHSKSVTALNEKEKTLDVKLTHIKKELLDAYKGRFPYHIPTRSDKRLINSRLYQFVVDLPKGGDLHVHCSQMMSVEDFIDYISKNEQIYICNKPGKEYSKLLYKEKDKEIPDGYINLNFAIKNNILTKETLAKLWTMKTSSYNSVQQAWDRFEQLFVNIDIIKNLEPDWICQFYHQAFLKYRQNNIQHVECRKSIRIDISQERERLLLIRKAYYDVKRIYPDFSVKIISAGFKYPQFSIEDTQQKFENAKILQKEIKDETYSTPSNFIIGLDLIHQEDLSRPLSEYIPILKKYKNKNMQLYMHAGETLKKDPASLNVAYSLKAKRVGHGYNLYMFGDLLKKYKKANIPLEICPISNLRLGYLKDLRLHPAVKYLKQGIPLVIASDDPLFLESSPLIDDWFAAIIAWDLNLLQIKQICVNSIKYSGLNKHEKENLMKNWNIQWENFVNKQLAEQD